MRILIAFFALSVTVGCSREAVLVTSDHKEPPTREVGELGIGESCYTSSIIEINGRAYVNKYVTCHREPSDYWPHKVERIAGGWKLYPGHGKFSHHDYHSFACGFNSQPVLEIVSDRKPKE